MPLISGMKDIKDKIHKNDNIKNIIKKLKNVVNIEELFKNNNLEEILSAISNIEFSFNYIDKDYGKLNTLKISKKEIIDELSNFKTESFKIIHKEVAINWDDSVKNENVIKNYRNFYKIIFNMSKKDKAPIHIFTTNYDLLNEKALEESNINFTTGFQGEINRKFNMGCFNFRLVDDLKVFKNKIQLEKNYIKLYKLHGSINWIKTNSSEIIQSNISDKNNDELQNMMIYPQVSKKMETLISPFSELLRIFSINLQNKDAALMIIGYGFNDDHINEIITSSLKSNPKSNYCFCVADSLLIEKKEFFEILSNLGNINFITSYLKEEEENRTEPWFEEIVDSVFKVYKKNKTNEVE